MIGHLTEHKFLSIPPEKMIKIQIAPQAGFCMGVRRAIYLTLEESRKSRDHLYTLGALIHNPQIIKLLSRRGVEPIDDIDGIETGKIIIRAHGIPPDLLEKVQKRGLEILDNTCPHVARIHKIIKRQYELGNDIIIVGDKGHAEVVGLEGYANNKAFVINTVEDVHRLPNLSNPCVVAQTTQSIRRFKEIQVEIRRRFPTSTIHDTICRATENRQAEIIELSSKNDLTIVVGGKISANTRRLVEVVQEAGKNAISVEDETELLLDDIKGKKSILVAAGASTPSWMIHRVIQHLRRLEYENCSRVYRWLMHVAEILLGGYFHLGAVAVLLSMAVWSIVGHPSSMTIGYLLIIFSYIIAMNTLNHLTNIEANQLQEIFKTDPINRYRLLYVILAAASSVVALVAGFWIDLYSGIFVALLEIAGLIYNINILPKRFAATFRHRRIKDIPLSKDMGISFTWTSIIVFLPVITNHSRNIRIIEWLFIGAIVAMISFLRALTNDLQEVQKDMFVGRETLPTYLGKKKVLWVAISLNALMILCLMTGIFSAALNITAFGMILLPFIITVLLILHYKETFPRMRNIVMIMDGAIAFSAIAVLCLYHVLGK